MFSWHEPQLLRFRARPELREIFYLDGERNRDHLIRIAVRVLDDPRRMREDAEQLETHNYEAGLLADFALERVDQRFAIFRTPGDERPSRWIKAPVEQERTVPFDHRGRACDARSVRFWRVYVLVIETRQRPNATSERPGTNAGHGMPALPASAANALREKPSDRSRHAPRRGADFDR